MRRVITFLVAAILLVAFAWWLAGLPGAFTIEVGDATLSTRTSVAILLAILAFVVLYAVVRLLALLVRLPSRTRRMRSVRARAQGDEAVTQTLLALAGGDAGTARRQAQRSRNLLGDTPQTLLLSAYAGRLGGNQGEANEAFNRLAARKDAAFLGLRGLMQGAIAQGDMTAAAAIAARAEQVNPGAAWLRTERSRLATRAGDWRGALALANPGDPVATFATAAADQETDPMLALKLARQAWKTDMAFAPAALAYTRRLRDARRDKRAQNVLRESWGHQPHPDLAEACLAGEADPMPREQRAEWLAAAAPSHPESQLLRARTAFDAGRLEDARRYADAAHAAGLDQRRLWLLLNSIAEAEGDAPAAADALRQAAQAEPDPQWNCGTCGTVHAEWRPVCSHCQAVGQINWGRPSVVANRRPLLVDGGDAILP